MKFIYENDNVNLLRDKKAVIISIPYSQNDEDVTKFHTAIVYNIEFKLGELVDLLIHHDIFNVYIALYNVDEFKYRTAFKKLDATTKGRINKIINSVFERIVDCYNCRNFVVTVQGKYFLTRSAISKMVLTTNMFTFSRRKAPKFAGNIETADFDEVVEKAAKAKMSNVACCVLIDIRAYIGHERSEDSFDRCLNDVATASFIGFENTFKVVC